jgi:hypothetical protein
MGYIADCAALSSATRTTKTKKNNFASFMQTKKSAFFKTTRNMEKKISQNWELRNQLVSQNWELRNQLERQCRASEQQRQRKTTLPLLCRLKNLHFSKRRGTWKKQKKNPQRLFYSFI